MKVRNVGRTASCTSNSVTTMSRIGWAPSATACQTPIVSRSRLAAAAIAEARESGPVRAKAGSATTTENVLPNAWRNAIASASPANPPPAIKTSALRALDRHFSRNASAITVGTLASARTAKPPAKSRMSIVDQLLNTLDLETLEDNLFRGQTPQPWGQRVFGGQVIGQALVAACRTVDVATARPIRCMPIFCWAAIPKSRLSMTSTASGTARASPRGAWSPSSTGRRFFRCPPPFTSRRPDSPIRPKCLTSQRRTSFRTTPRSAPRSCPKHLNPVRRFYERERPIILRPVTYERYRRKEDRERHLQRLDTLCRALPDDPALHQCVLAYASDMALLDAALIPHGLSVFDRQIMAASLDHALWFHRPFRADEWLLYSQDSPNSSGARGFSRGMIFALDGTLVASVAQEGLLRPRREERA